MANKGKLYVSLASVLSLTLAGQFVYSPVFANGPVNISIVEMADDGSGNLNLWEDITGAMPGMNYSAIPRVLNNGDVAVPVTMCLTESGIDVEGNMIELDAGTFQIDINDTYWTRVSGEDNDGIVASPIMVCYKYSSDLAVGDMTEPLFHEIYLSEQLGNEHRNATFNLHLEAYAESGDIAPDESSSVAVPGEPDTGVFTESESLTTVEYVFLSLGAAGLVGMMVYLLLKASQKE